MNGEVHSSRLPQIAQIEFDCVGDTGLVPLAMSILNRTTALLES